MNTPVSSFTTPNRAADLAPFNHSLASLGKSPAAGQGHADSAGAEPRALGPLTRAGAYPYLAGSQAAPSSNGKTTDSDSVNRGSNPRGASILRPLTAVRKCTGFVRFVAEA